MSRERRTPARQSRGLPVLTQKELEEEESRREERNRAVYKAWLEKKREERKVCIIIAMVAKTVHLVGAKSPSRKNVL